MENKIIQSNALLFAKKEKKRIAKKFVDKNKYPPSEITLFQFLWLALLGREKQNFQKES